MRAQEEAAGMIGRLRTEKTSLDDAHQHEQRVIADLRSEVVTAGGALNTANGELDTLRRQLERAATQRDELMEHNSRGNREYQRLQSEHQAVLGSLHSARQEAIAEHAAMVCEIQFRDEALAQASVDALEHAQPSVKPQNLGLGETQNFSSVTALAGGMGNEPSFARLPELVPSVMNASGNSQSVGVATTTAAARLASSCDAASVTQQQQQQQQQRHGPLFQQPQTSASQSHSGVGIGSESTSHRQSAQDGMFTRAFRGNQGPTGLGFVEQASRQAPHLMSTSASSSHVGATSWFASSPSDFVERVDMPTAQVAYASQDHSEVRKDRNKLPDIDFMSSASDPVQTIHGFEMWILRCATSISTWCKNPKDAVGWWNSVLDEATRHWVRWSMQSPTDRKMEALQRSFGGSRFQEDASSVFEAVLRSDLLERMPRVVVERVYSENRLNSRDILEELMRATLPAFHTVKVTLLDSIETPGNRCTTYAQLQTSLRTWSRGARIAMSRYNLTPEPRRMWLSILSRMAGLQSEPMFAAIMDRHVVSTGVRTIQSLESVLGFVISMEAEVDAILQDQTQTGQIKSNPKAHSGVLGGAPVPQRDALRDSPKSKPGALDVCKSWGTEKGCKFGKACRYRHPYAKVSDGLCFLCGAKEHNSKNCPYDTRKPDSKGAKPGGGPGKDGSGKPGKGKDGSGKPGKGGRDARPGSGNSRAKSGERSQKGSRPASSGRKPSNDSRGKGQKGSSAKSVDASAADADGQKKAKPEVPKASNPARALSTAVDHSTCGDGLLDSGASHVIAPMEELPEQERSEGQRVSRTLASGKPAESMIRHGEVYANRVRRVLIPFGKLVRQTGLLAVWSKS
eukprot:5710977-Amphidinium_carterae.1